jgi:hypothetical protein
MAKTADLRLYFFERYSENLHLLHDNGMLPGLTLQYEQTYICPLCYRQFSKADLDLKVKNHLTLEDVPPKSLGGKANILTCKECNNVAGHQVDSHLTAGLRALDARKFLPGSEAKVRIKTGEKTVQGSIKVEANGTIRTINSYKNNHRQRLDEYIKSISPKEGRNLLSVEFIPSNSNDRRLQIGLLKTAYLQAFEKFGYKYCLRPSYNPVREQIQNPDHEIYPLQFWFLGPFTENQSGTHFVVNEGLECIMPVFPLTTSTTRIFAAILPLKDNPIIEIVAGFHASLALNAGYADFQRFDLPEGYLRSLHNIHELDEFELQILNR